MTPGGEDSISRFSETRPGERLGPTERLRLGRRLKELRGTRTLEDVAGEAGLAASSLSKLERGGTDPRLGSLLRLQRALHLTTIEQLLGPMPEPGELPSVSLGRRLSAPGPAAEAS